MRAVRKGLVLGLGLLVTLAACGDRTPVLMNLSSDTPDEFGIVPNKPLEMPEDYAALPAPNPGGPNRADATPEADAVAALGGSPAVLGRDGVPASERGLVSYATRFGVAPDIRTVLAREDLEWRRDNNGRLLERLFNVNVYYKAYRRMSLDRYAELERFRRAGVRTPAAPPEPAE
ncbi:DUF3035 domain-containing protein [Rhodovulum sp. YNF3179]|uniref:DUF3035 domain-containing protein n=1 Tax=Rhodovulum sp. YNF3179 TaxID=3425127 RepID=UPI003D32AA2B